MLHPTSQINRAVMRVLSAERGNGWNVDIGRRGRCGKRETEKASMESADRVLQRSLPHGQAERSPGRLQCNTRYAVPLSTFSFDASSALTLSQDPAEPALLRPPRPSCTQQKKIRKTAPSPACQRRTAITLTEQYRQRTGEPKESRRRLVPGPFAPAHLPRLAPFAPSLRILDFWDLDLSTLAFRCSTQFYLLSERI